MGGSELLNRLSFAGKTYTVTGTAEDPGLLPRSLDVIFNKLEERQLSSLAIKPKHFSEVLCLSQQEQEAERQRKQATLTKVGDWPDAEGMSVLALL